MSVPRRRLFPLPLLLLGLTTACAASLGDADGEMDPTTEPSDPNPSDPNPSDPTPVPVQTICDDALGNTAADLAKAMELCDGTLLSVELSTVQAEQASVVTSYGDNYLPKAGSAMATIATGEVSKVADKDLSVYDVTETHPKPGPDPADGCGQADPANVQDMVKLTLNLKAPAGALGFQFDFNFMSAEFPEYLCTEFDDTFLVMLESEGLSGNISFDEKENVISINTGFFDVCSPANGANCGGAAELAGTGYDDRGGTGWLTTKAPITPNEEFSLTFYLFDEGDAQLTSQVLIDNFQWSTEDIDDPITID
jgi:hypothetical protein